MTNNRELFTAEIKKSGTIDLMRQVDTKLAEEEEDTFNFFK